MNRALHQALLLAGTLAVIAGLLGMHVLTAGHASHGLVAQGVVPHSAASHTAPAGHTAVVHSTVGEQPGHTGHAVAAASMDAPALAPSTCGTSCPGAQESGAPCIPTAPGSPVTVAPPQATFAVVSLLPPAGDPSSSYGYLPPSPSPCDLSISRT
ncbi:hypothetical protein [Pseudarthrobacter sp. lyk4-40-TYG-27]|uniref:hypothetical protein n=1 Tax=Pseudarthrobacter sp. lyk4-40-TYG-27 TaxID=3040305 RepID=UPI002552F175|nr:hypothetical protein [Pseudarthrobacter sp. lyk4-40-TYG-27]